ncbi:MAG TPA: hypothetical protein VGG61_08295 [Gemmataceae bacterium]
MLSARAVALDICGRLKIEDRKRCGPPDRSRFATSVETTAVNSTDAAMVLHEIAPVAKTEASKA